MSKTSPSRPSSREAFIETTATLLRRQGYAATGLSEIVARSGAPRGSLYYHFPGGKEELAVAALTRAGEQLQAGIAATLDARSDLDAALALLLDGLAAGLVASDYADGCPLATVALEAAGASEPLRAAAADAFDGWLGAITRRIEAAGVEPPAARRRATLVLAAIEGALILARARRDPEPLHEIRDELVPLARASSPEPQ